MPMCKKCDGVGYTVMKEADPCGNDDYIDCECGALDHIARTTQCPMCFCVYDKKQGHQCQFAGKMTMKESAYLTMYEVLGDIKDCHGWDNLDVYIQNKINKAIKVGKNGLK